MKLNNILIAEDNDDIRELMAGAISYLNCEVSVASNGEEALKMIKKDKPDILILDIKMPKKNGFEVLKEIKKSKITKDIYVIVFTVRVRAQDIEMGYALGADVYFCKPRDIIPEVKKALKLVDALKNGSEESSGKMA